MEMPGGKRIKTDKRDAWLIAKCLANGGYNSVYIPTPMDEDIRDYLRMREDHKAEQKNIKHEITAFCLRHGLKYDRTCWTGNHVKWLQEVKLSELQRETLDEYLITYKNLEDKLARMDARIEELASREEYREKVSKLSCFVGIKTSLIAGKSIGCRIEILTRHDAVFIQLLKYLIPVTAILLRIKYNGVI